MTVCRFFLQGNCHFGERCRFEHPRNNQPPPVYGGGGGGGGGFGGNRGGFQTPTNNRFSNLGGVGGGQANPGSKAGAQPSIKDMSPREIADIISQEMKVWDASRMWPFSCFTYSKDGQCISGFDDISPEELRKEAYETQKNNTFHLYQRKVMTLVQEYKQKRMALKTQPPDIKQKLLQEIQAHKAGIKGDSNNTFGPSQFASGSSSGLFGQTTSTAAAPSQGLFGKPAAAPQSQVPQGLFGNKGGMSQAQPAQSQFGARPSVFGGSAPIGGSVFGGSASGQQPTSQAPSLFGSVPTSSASTGVFGQQQAQQPPQQQQPPLQQPFQQTQPPTGLFGKPVTQATPVIAPSAGLFNPQGAVPPSSQPSGAGLFGKGPAPTGLFGKPVTGASSAFGGNPAPPAFGGGSQIHPTGLGQQAPQRDGLYTPLDQLTDEEKSQYSAAAFELGRIPIRPPPREMVQ